MRYFGLLVWLLALTGVSAACPPPGGAEVRIGLSVLPEARLEIRDRVSAVAGQVEASVRIGDPVSIHIRLWNAGDSASEPTVRLSTRIAPLAVVVKRPDGSTVHAPWEWRMGGVVRAMWATPMPLQPGEEQIIETFLFEFRSDDPATGRSTTEYLFEKEGRYEVYVEYWAGDPAEHWRFRRGEREDEPPVLRSAPVVFEVAGPSIEGWEELKDAGIIHFIGRHDWPALVDAGSPINATVDAADRPWLNEWRDRVLARAAEK